MKLIDHDVFISASPSAVFRVIADPGSKMLWVPCTAPPTSEAAATSFACRAAASAALPARLQ